ncbi:alpha,alpha-trehalose-phosphate synthase (UDP-forming) [Sphingobium sp. Ant17]|jgi:trehalose 6-phosphate synthase|uniref:alpha,alpha-trehalose-phosphate synthase (UDP-forming) n=1 Tax=Sphingobium sp. Ant17 TaxID=1461752 RepID=UPI0004505C8B|nr:alpha,alpha-trehalose-phosphate synthase (UDP-forming) [Sphingobium sp. Ant17]EXS70173.1 alpha,alpha-trehalose-phosphate synthase [Sphingobium sp. Ant17]OHC98189.1 MAG: alpha,alpha-trehalose-phosphate synthase (UDP-forming) [Sphingomonadales bacterium GWF1_63_6]|tara:strand:+ start:9407 stop:10813 length:1407 start_codon:yes stop_codon:yes gene_type:complete
MSRLIVISNRVSRPSKAGNQGGLAVALAEALRESRGTWIGWSGEVTDNFTGHIGFAEDDGVKTATIDLEEQDIDEYYNGYANKTLWPLFHFRIDLAEYARDFEGGYNRVNERFADTAAPLIEPDDVIWVHDYHMIPLGQMLRDRGHRNRMGFFLHIPWPPTRLLVSLPHHTKLVSSLFAYDVVGFHTEEWLESFRHYVEKEMGGQVDGDFVTVGDRTIQAVACPIGINAREFAEAAESKTARDMLELLRASLQDRAMIVGVDRLDYSKGLEERFNGYARFLKDHPEHHRKVLLTQIAPPSRGEVESYQQIRATLDSLAGRINGEYSDVDWTPIRYVNQGYPRDKLSGIYRAAKIGLVTPLRDGMNLVAKEYVAAQDPEDPGVLILSRFAGAALQLKDALLINPYSPEEMSDAINRALAMPLDERKRRWRAMMDSVEQQDISWWRQSFTERLMAVDRDTARVEPEPVDG